MSKLRKPFLIEFGVRVGKDIEGVIFDIQRYSIKDGPGIRTTVFFKGCPLRCLWCANPESKRLEPQLFYQGLLCVKCYRCIEACPTRASTISTDGSIQINRELCIACGQCMKVCQAEARMISGKAMSVEEVLEIVEKDSLFYRNSGGGITASGGEPTYQIDFLLELFKRCPEMGLHTTLDTCGHVRWDKLQSILEYTDLILLDIKHMDPVKHKEFTGASNRLILENARRIVQKGKSMIVRLPLIPGYNDSKKNIEAVGKFLNQISTRQIDILPYHQLGTKKYESFGEEYKLKELRLFKEEQVESIKQILKGYGLDVSIG